MMNMLDTQDKLKNFSEQQLIGQMQSPTGDVPQFLVLGEIERRKRMRNDAQRQQGTNQTTVAQDAVVAAGVPQTGIADMAQALAPQTDMAQNTGIMSVAPQAEPQRMASGGVVKMADGMTVPSPEEQALIDKRNKFYRDLYGGISDRVLSTTSGLAANYNDLESYASNAVAGLTGLVPGLEGFTLEELKAAKDKAALAERQREYSNRRAEEVVERTNAGATELQNPLVREALRNPPVLPTAPVAQVQPGLPAVNPDNAGGGTGGTGKSAASSYEQALLDTLANREKAQKQDKWLALAQVGLGMMNSQSPSLAGAIGEAGLKGVESFRQSRDQYDTDRMKILGDIEQYKMARAAAQARASGGGGGGFRQELKDQASVMGLIEDLQGQADAIRENAALSGGKDLEAEKRARAFEARANTLASMIGIDAGNAGGPATLALPSAAQP
jgi:hypothetical protein